jgi:glycosyltransferase involved in cell wall biosynthesis
LKRVLFFIENNWVFGKIFNELTKHVYPTYDCDIFDWGKVQPREHTDWMQQKYDLFFSTPVGCFFLHDTYGIPLERCYGHAHSDFDIVDARKRFPREYFDRLCGYAVVSEPLRYVSFSHGVQRVPAVLPVGVTCANYQRPAPTKIEKLGYFGRMARKDGDFDIKRGYLAQAVAEQAGLQFVNREHVPFFIADRLYHEVDLVMFCSLVEGNPYVVLESCAAGVPILGTPAGIFPSVAATGAGVVLPMEEEAFIKSAVKTIQALQNEPALYARMCQAAGEVSKTFDWSVIKRIWLEEFQKATAL